MRVLFITSNRIGDAVLSTGLLRHVIAAHPQSRLTVACGPVAAPLFRAVPGLERVAVLRKRTLARHWLALWRDCVGIRWDWVIDLRNSAVSRLVWAGRRSIFYSSPSTAMAHKVEELAAVLGLAPPPAPGLWIDAEARAVADRLLPADGAPLLALGPTANWLSKEWPADRFAAVAQRLTAAGGPLAGGRVAVLAAGGDEAARARPLLDALGPAGIDLTGRTDPLAAAACLERAALYIGNDSGLMHIAAAVGTPTLGLFGPGFPERYAPWGPRARVVTGSIPRDALLDRLRAADRAPIPLMQGIAVSNVEEAAVCLLGDVGYGKNRVVSSGASAP